MVYLDNAATPRVCPEAAEAAVHMMTECFGNPSTPYKLGREAKAAVDKARGQIAKALGCQPDEVYFTSCGSEGDNWALISGARYMRRRGKHIISSAVEHDAVRKSLDFLEKEGYESTRLQPDGTGAIPLEAVRAALRPDTILVSLMMVNNETGAVMPIADMVKATRRAAPLALFHTDAVQGFLKVPFRAKALGADMISVSAHKIHAAKGTGALYIRPGLPLPAFLNGGGQESNYRSGTENMPGICGFGAACADTDAKADIARMAQLRDLAREKLSGIDGLVLIGSQTAPPSSAGRRTANSTTLRLPGTVATFSAYCSGARMSDRVAPGWVAPRIAHRASSTACSRTAFMSQQAPPAPRATGAMCLRPCTCPPPSSTAPSASRSPVTTLKPTLTRAFTRCCTHIRR